MSASVGETRGEERRVVFHSKARRFAALRKEGAAALGSKHESVHLVPGAAAYDDGGSLDDPSRSGSLLLAELIRLSSLEKRQGYRERVHEPLWAICQTLAEILVHSKKICSILSSVYASEDPYVSSFSLASVLAREAGEALEGKGLDELVDGLVKAIESPNPEAARAAFASLSYVFRYCSASLLRGAEETGWPHARKWYASLLCGRSADTRTLGARAVASLVRRLNRKAIGKHVRRLLASLDANKRLKTSQESGVARLLFEISRGVGGRLHTRATPVFENLLMTSAKTERTRGESTERVAETLEKLVLDDARPGEEIEELWRVLATAAKIPSTATSRAVERLAVAVEWRSGRLLTSRGEADVAMPAEIASKRASDLAECLDALCRDGSEDDLLDATLRLARATARVADRSTTARETLGGSVEQWLLKLVSRPRDRARASETLADLGATSPALADAAFKAAIDLASVDTRTALFVAAKTVGGGHPRKSGVDATPLRDLVVATITAAANQYDRPSLLAALSIASAVSVPVDKVRAVAEHSKFDAVVRSTALDSLVDLDSADVAKNILVSSLTDWRRREQGLPAAATLRCASDVLAPEDITDDDESRGMVDALVAKAAKTSERRHAMLAVRLASRLEKDESLAFALDSFRQIHELPISLESERAYSKLVNGLEVLSRSPDLTQRTADALAVGGLELLYVKFEPLWALAKTLLEQLASSHPQVLWPRLLYRLRSVCEPPWTTRVMEESDPAPHPDALCRADALNEASGDRFAALLARSYEDDEEDRKAPVDPERAFDIVWDTAKRCGILSGQPTSADAARVAVTLFLSFFKRDFARVFEDDPDATEIVVTILRHDDDVVDDAAELPPLLSRPMAYKRLETILRVFSDARAPRSLPRCDDLQHLFERLLGKPRGQVAKLALGCLRNYKLSYLTPYANRLDSMLDDKTLRDTLVKMKVGSALSFTLDSEEDQKTDKWTVDDEHRADFAPLLCRLLFGRFRAKSSAVGGRRRGAPKARRATILSFIAGLEPENLDFFVFLMVRPFLNQCDAASSLDPSLILLRLRAANDAEQAVTSAKPSQVAGLLQLIRATVPRFGFKTEKHAPLFVSLALATIRSCGGGDNVVRNEDVLDDAVADDYENDAIDEDDDDADDNAPHNNNRRQAKRTRALAVRCVTDLLDQYATGESIWKIEGGLSYRLWSCIGPHLRPLFDPDRHLDNEPVVVELISRVATAQHLKPLLTDDCVRACCLRAANGSRMALGAVCSLVLGDDTDEADVAARKLLLPYSRTVVAALTAELESKKKNIASIFSSRASSSRIALDALCRVATYAKLDEWPLESEDASALASALSPRLLVVVDSSNGVDPTPMRKMMLECLRTILPRVGHALRHVDEFVTLLSPPRPRKVATAFYSASDCLDARRAVAEACVALLQTHPDLRENPTLSRAADLLAALAGVKQNDAGTDSEGRSSLEPDYELESAALSQLANVVSWSEEIFDKSIKDIASAPLVAHCVSTMRSGDPALRDAATRAVRCFVAAAFSSSTTSPVLERTLVPHILDSLDVADDATRRAHVMVLSAIVTAASANATADDALFADLCALQSPEDPEIDFFENIAHFQTHRRSKALRRAIANSDRLTATSVRRVLIPLSLQPLRDHRSADALRADAAACLGAAASRLPWSRYASLIKGLCARLKAQQQGTSSNESSAANPTQLFSEQSSNKKRKGSKQDAAERKNIPKSLEAASVAAICATLDAFPFDFSENDSEDKVLTGVMQWLLPTARHLMNKPVRNKKTGAREEILRSPIALSLARFASRLPSSHRTQERRALVVAVCAALRNRDATQRDICRATLAKMVRTHLASTTGVGDEDVVQMVLEELESALKSGGYMLAVRSAALHSILSTLAASGDSRSRFKDERHAYNPRASVNVAIGKIAHLLVDDLLGQAATARDTHESGDHKAGSAAGVPEAKNVVTRTYESFELAARALDWTTNAVRELLDPVVSALRERAAEIDDRQAAEAARCRTALARVATGLAVNASATADGVLDQTVDMLRVGLGVSGDESFGIAENDDDEDDDDEELLPVIDDATAVVARKKRRIAGKAVTWMPSHEGTSADGAEARRRKKEGERENVRVLDGAQAPKLTGRQKGANEERAEADADGAMQAETIRAAVRMLRHAIKKRGGDLFDKKTMRNPEASAHRAAVPLPELMAKVYKKRAVADDELQLDIVHVASALLSWQLKTAHLWAKRLAKIALATLSRSAKSGMFLGADAVQASFKMLATLISHQKQGEFREDSSDDEDENGFYAVTLADRQLKAIVSSVHVALSSSRDEGSFVSHRASTYALLKALVQRPVVVSEIYDCMNTIAEVRVTSLDTSERRRASSIFLNFLMNYQMGKKRRKHHMSQLVEGLDYEYVEGRLAAVESLGSALRVLPATLVDEQSEVFFASLSLRVANEDEEDCARRVADTFVTFLRRLPDPSFRKFVDRASTWLEAALKGEDEEKLRRLRLLGVRCVEALCRSNATYLAARPDLVESLLIKLVAVMKLATDDVFAAYVRGATRILGALPEAGERALSRGLRLVHLVVDSLALSSARIDASLFIGGYLSRRSPLLLRVNGGGDKGYEYLEDDEESPLTKIAKASITHIDVNEADPYDHELGDQSSKNLLFVTAALHQRKEDESVAWIFDRVSSMSCRRGEPRRRAVFSWFAAVAADEHLGASVIVQHLDRVVAPLHRAIEDEEREERQRRAYHNKRSSTDTSAAGMAHDLMRRLEDVAGAPAMAKAVANVAAALKSKRDARKQKRNREAVTDPEGAALRKLERNREKRRKTTAPKKRSRGVVSVASELLGY